MNINFGFLKKIIFEIQFVSHKICNSPENGHQYLIFPNAKRDRIVRNTGPTCSNPASVIVYIARYFT